MKLKSCLLLVFSFLLISVIVFASGIQKKLVDDSAYDSDWNGDTINAPSRNAAYDEMESVKVSTGATKVLLDAVIISTGAIQVEVDALEVSTGAIKTLLDAVIVSTGAIQTELDAVIVSTGTFVKKAGDTMTGGLIVSSTTRITGNATLEKNAYLGGFLFHYGDTNTYLRFSDDDVLIQAGALQIIQGCEGTIDVIHLGDADWDYLVIGDTTTGVYLTTFTYSTGEWSFPADVYINKGDKVIATSSMTWTKGDMLYYDGANWVMVSTAGASAGDRLQLTGEVPAWEGKSYACVTKAVDASTTTIVDTYIIVGSTWGINFGADFSVSGATITYTGSTTKTFGIIVSITARSSVANTVCHWKVAVNGVLNDSSIQGRKIAVAGDIASISLNCLGELDTDDEISIRISADKVSTITHENMNVTLIEAD